MSQQNVQTPPEAEANRIFLFLERVGKLRDGFLVAGAILYFMGYVTWSLNSWRNGLGLLPAVESQYFIAGVVPAAVIFLSYLLVKLGTSLALKIQEWLRPRVSKNRLLWLAIYFILPIGLVLSIFRALGSLKTSPLIVVLLLMAILFSSAVVPDLNKSPSSQRFTKVSDVVLLTFLVLVPGLVAITFYVQVIYPSLPQALGGVKPRTVCLDLSKGDLSEETERLLVPAAEGQNPAAGDERSTVHSKEVELMFAGGDYILVRVGGVICEIKKDLIHAVRSCG
jgi:hypothetical protein